MAKRKLSKQQKRRVEDVRQREFDAEQDTTSGTNSLGQKQPGLVITNFGKRIMVESESGELFNCSVRQHLGKLVAGDVVTWQADIEPQTGVVSAVEPRTQELSRPGFRGDKRMVAANIDQLGIVAPVEPGIHPDMIDRYLVAAHQLQLPAFIIINKVDLVENDQQWEDIAELLWAYDELQIDILPVSNVTGEGMDELREFLANKNSVFVGVSGAGKSSLIKALIPDIDIKTNALSDSSGLGQHTTTNSILYHLPKHNGAGGNIIDTPGVRLFSPAPCELHELEQAFADFEPFLGHCKFSNCTHQKEPDCAIQKAVENEDIAESRFQSFQRLLEEFS